MGLDFLIPPKATNHNESMAEFVSRRLGREAYEGLVEPLMSGIYAGDGEKLSLRATLPYLAELEQEHGGLVRGALSVRAARARNGSAVQGSRSLFQTPLTGLAELVETLENKLRASGHELHAGKSL
jgi:oxygen-dependent protoporphyrinogen oxidase